MPVVSWRDTAADVDATHCETFQGEIAGLGAVDGDEHIQRRSTQRVLAAERMPTDGGTGIAAAQFFTEPARFAAMAAVAQKLIDVVQTWAGQDAFIADVAVKALAKIFQQFNSRSVRGEKSQWPPSLAIG